MKKNSALFFFLIFACPVTFLGPAVASQDWYPFEIKETIDLNSPVHFNPALLDGPAGKHGFLTAKGKEFVFLDGTPAKFWGTNLCFSANFPDKYSAEKTAERLAYFGFNAVRLHHMDTHFEPQGIFRDTAVLASDPQEKRSGTLSPTQLDRLDYFIAQLKKRGIYIDINLLVKRSFTEMDGVPEAAHLPGGAHPASLFDSTLIKLQKKYANDLLTHLNPYTGMRYADDPAVALIEITNENSFFGWAEKKIKALPDFYAKELKKLLREQMQTTRDGKQLSREEALLKIERVYFQEMQRFLKAECGVKTLIVGTGGAPGAQDFEALKNSDFFDLHAYWDHPRFPKKNWDNNDFTMHSRSALADKEKGMLGALLKEMPQKFGKPMTVTEWEHCYPNPYAYESPVLMAAEGSSHGWGGLFQFAYSHDNLSKLSQMIKNYFDVIANPQQLILDLVGSYVFLRSNSVEVQLRDNIMRLRDSNMVGVVGSLKGKVFEWPEARIQARQDGAIFLLSLNEQPLTESRSILLVTVGEVKNSESGWFFSKYNWGKPPVLLKHVPADIFLKTTHPLMIYALDGKGSRAMPLKTKKKSIGISFTTQDVQSPWFLIEQKL